MMKVSKLEIEFTHVLLFEETNLSKCHVCKDVIYSKMWRLWIEPRKNVLHLPLYKTDVVLCDSCKSILG